jgi:Concanavalin A-like lectin/glucanases superfamily
MFRFSDGFDSYAATADLSKKWDSVGTNWAWNGTAGVNGGGAIVNTGAAGNEIKKIFRVASGVTTNAYCSFWVKIASAPTQGGLVYFYDGASVFCGGLALSSAGLLGVLSTSPAGGPYAVSAVNVCNNTWRHIEFTISKTAGTSVPTLTSYVDGVSVQTSVGGGTPVGGAGSSINTVTIRSIGVSITVDDLIVWDSEGSGLTTTPMGIRTIETLRPSGAGSSAQFTPVGAASNYDCVDETNADSDTTYVSSSTAAQKDLYAFGNLGSTPTTITAAVVNTVARVGTVGGIATVRARAKSSSSEASGTSIDLQSVNYAAKQEAFVTDPATSTAWTGAGINAAEFGVELVA